MFTLHFLLKANIEKLLSSKPKCLIYSEDRTSNGRKRRKTNNGERSLKITAHSSASTSEENKVSGQLTSNDNIAGNGRS